MRFARVHHNRISLISNNSFDGAVEVPKSLDFVESKDLLINYKYKNGLFVTNAIKPVKNTKIALISNYGAKCGIGTYSKFLYDEIVNEFADYKIFVEENDVSQIEYSKIPNDKIIPCWNRGQSPGKLINEIKTFDPDVVLIQHEFGLFNARDWLVLMTQLSCYRVIVTMHSVYKSHEDKVIIEASIPEIIVHLDGAKTCLKEEKKVAGKVYVIPHGSFPSEQKPKLWNIYQTTQNFLQTGFGFRYKRFEYGIQATALLKAKYPNIFYTAIFSESPHAMYEHELYYNELIELIDKLDVQNNVAIIRGFQSDNVIDSFVRTNQVGLFAYGVDKQFEVFGASGASRILMSKGLPIISSSIPHFSDMPTIKADTIEEIAKALDMLFSDKNKIKEQIKLQDKYIEDTTWAKISRMYLDVIECN